MATGDSTRQFYAGRITGGLETRQPPTKLDPSASPDLENVVLNDDAVSRRGGFVPFIRQHPNASAVENRGLHIRVAERDTSAPPAAPVTYDGESVIVPGALYAGDREVWRQYEAGATEFCVDFFLTISDLTKEAIGPFGTDLPYPASPIPIRCRPIISKGPVKKSLSTFQNYDFDDFGVDTIGKGASAWNNTNAYGPAGRMFEMVNIENNTPAPGQTRITTRQPHGQIGSFAARIVGTGSRANGTVDGVDGVRTCTVVDATRFTIPVAGVGPELGAVWLTPARTDYGTFCVYLGREEPGEWQFRFSCNTLDPVAAEFNIKTVASTVVPEVGPLYHVIASMQWATGAANGRMILRIGVWNSVARTFVYSDAQNTDILTNEDHAVSMPTGPVQVFDCPQVFVAASSTSSKVWDATLFRSEPPGIGLEINAHGGYFYAARRFEGAIEDIVVRNVALQLGSTDVFDRDGKFDIDAVNGADILQYWDMQEPGMQWVAEKSGRSNHLYFAPSVPIADTSSGGIDGASNWFNGQNSYLLVSVAGNPNWRYRPNDEYSDEVLGALNYVVQKGLPFGLQVEFWVDTTSEPFEQVLAEIHGVMRCVVMPDGRFGVYYRDAVNNSAGLKIQRYVGPVVSSFQSRPGRRYSVLFFFLAGNLEIYIDGVRNVSVAIGSPTLDAWPISGWTIGMGARRFTCGTDDITSPVRDAGKAAGVDQINTDSRSGFIGRIENVRLVVGDYNEHQVHNKLGTELDWRFEQPKLWHIPDEDHIPATVQRRWMEAKNRSDLIADLTLGHIVRVSQHRTLDANGGQVRIAYVHEGVDNNAQLLAVQLGPNQPTVSPPNNEVVEWLRWGGAEELDGARCEFYYVVADMALSVSGTTPVGDTGQRGGRYTQGLEWRQGYHETVGPTVAAAASDTLRHVFAQNSRISDRVGFFRFVEGRCIESDTLYERETGRFYGGINKPYRNAVAYAGPWGFRSPRELGPRWVPGLVRPRTRTNGITLIADWRQQAENRRFVVVAASRSVYWAKSIWEKDSPFATPDDGSLFLLGQPGEHIECFSSQAVEQDLTDTPSWNVITIEAWVKPFRLDGDRILFSRSDIQKGDINYVVGTHNGAIFVGGSFTGAGASWLYHEGANTDQSMGWTTEGRIASSRFKVGQWNHVHVLLGDNSGSGIDNNFPVVFVNGERVELTRYDATATGGLQSDLADAGSPNLSLSNQLYIGGHPLGYETIEFPFSGGTLSMRTESWFGLITEVRQRNIEDPNFPGTAGSTGILPTTRYANPTGAANVGYLFHFNEQQGWIFPNERVGAGLDDTDGAVSQIAELVLIGSGLDESSGSRYQSAVFRDLLYLTNGVSPPQEIEFHGFAADSMFSMRRMGMLEPIRETRALTLTWLYSATPKTAASINYFGPGLYQIFVAFKDELGRESEPTLLQAQSPPSFTSLITGWTLSPPPSERRVTILNAPDNFPTLQNGQRVTLLIAGTGTGDLDRIWQAFVVTGGAPPTVFQLIGSEGTAVPGSNGQATIYPDGVRVDGVPRSTDPQVVGRRFYVSSFGGGAPVQHSDLDDNESNVYEILAPGASTIAAEFGRRLVAPNAKIVSVGVGSVLLGHLVDVGPAGEGSFAWSDGAEATYFPDANLVAIDDSDTQPILGIRAHLGRVYISTRNSIYQFSATGSATPTSGNVLLRLVNQSLGVGAGMTLYDNLIYGAGERGVCRFDGANVAYSSPSLEGDWRDLPITDADMLGFFGAYHRDESQFWLSLRRTGTRANDRVYVLHTGVFDPARPGHQPWTRLIVPPHTYLDNIKHPITERPEILIGTSTGALLIYDRDIYVDGHDDVRMPGQTQSNLSELSATVVDAFTIQVATPLDTVRDGLRGMPIIVVAANGVYLRVIESNTQSRIHLSEAMDPLPNPLLVAWTAGNYDAYWSSGWIAPQKPGQFLLAHDIDLEFDASPYELTVSNATAIVPASGNPILPTRKLQDSQAVLEVRNLDMSNGFQENPLPVQQRTRGRYFRVLFSTSFLNQTGIRARWQINSWGFRYHHEGIRAGRPR